MLESDLNHGFKQNLDALALKQEIIQHSPCDRGKINLVYPGFELMDKTAPGGNESQAYEGPVVLFVGRLAPEKGPLDSLRAFAAMRKRLGRGSFLVLGAGPLESVVDDAERKFGVGRMVEATIGVYQKSVAGGKLCCHV